MIIPEGKELSKVFVCNAEVLGGHSLASLTVTDGTLVCTTGHGSKIAHMHLSRVRQCAKYATTSLRTRLVCAWALGAMLIAGIAAGEPLPPRNVWIRITSENFFLFTNGDKETAISIAQDLERFRAALISLLPARHGDLPFPTYVYVLGNRTLFDRYIPSPDPEHPTTGIFIRDPYANYVVINGDSDREPLRTVFHEYTHYYLMCNLVQDLPVWLNEGLAEYCSTFMALADTVKLGNIIADHVLRLREQDFIPLERFLSVNEQSAEYREGEERSNFYSQSWAFVHYLLSLHAGEERLVHLRVFLERLDAGEPVSQAIDEEFSIRLQELPALVKGYVAGSEYTYLTITFKRLKANTSVVVSPMDYVEVLYRLGDLLLHRDPDSHSQAMTHFDAALQINPRHGPSLAALGEMTRLEGYPSRAVQLFERAIEADPQDAHTLWLAANNLMETLTTRYPGVYPEGPTPEEAVQARRLLERAVQIEPKLIQAQSLLGRTYLYGNDDPRPGIAPLERAILAIPSDHVAAYDLFLLYLRAGDVQAAQRIEATVLRFSKNPEIVDGAREALLRQSITRVNSLASAGLIDEALELVRNAAMQSKDASFKQYLVELESQLQGFAAEQLNIDTYNQAVSLANTGHYSEAEKLLADLSKRSLTPDLRDATERLLDDVRRAMR